MPKIDICIVSTRRPDLLSATLNSFSKSVFRHFEIDGAFINMDPIFGDEDDHKQSIDHFRSLFPRGIVFEPETANFAAAVQRLWSATRSEFVMHLEDDWVALTDIDPSALEPFQDPSVSQVSLHTVEKNWDIKKKGNFHKKNTYVTLFGVKIPTFSAIPRFTTSPSFLRGDFARQCSNLMDQGSRKAVLLGGEPSFGGLCSKAKKLPILPRQPSSDRRHRPRLAKGEENYQVHSRLQLRLGSGSGRRCAIKPAVASIRRHIPHSDRIYESLASSEALADFSSPFDLVAGRDIAYISQGD